MFVAPVGAISETRDVWLPAVWREGKGSVPVVLLDGEQLTIDDLTRIARTDPDSSGAVIVQISPDAERRVKRCRDAVDRLIADGRPVYGLNTGFGALQSRQISPGDLAALQVNLIRSHAAGIGAPLPVEVVRGMLAIRANTLAKGYSGIRLETLRLFVELLNRGVTPVVPEKGSVCASGDLAPLAHLALVLLGEGEAYYRGERLAGAVALRRAGLAPVADLAPKEGLALVNGTSAATAIGALVLHDAFRLSGVADLAAALTFEGLAGLTDPLRPEVHRVRPHPGQAAAAAGIAQALAGSELVGLITPQRVQDPYALRCTPQVHGAARDALDYARRVIETELNSATDNPLVFPDDEGDGVQVISQGNFHGQPVSVALDVAGIAVQDFATVSERRLTWLLAHRLPSLPIFLTDDPGLNSGFMIVQVAAAALVAENRVLAHPASVDTVPTSDNYEDHVSMGMTAARKAREIVSNVEYVLAFELLAGAQAIDYRWREEPALRQGTGTRPVYEAIRSVAPFAPNDVPMQPLMEAVAKLIRSDRLTDASVSVAQKRGS